MYCYLFGKLTYVRQYMTAGGSMRVALSVHDGYRSNDFIVYEHERDFRTGELRKSALFASIAKLNLKEGCYVNIWGQVYSKEGSKVVVFRPYAIHVVKSEDYEACKRLGFNI